MPTLAELKKMIIRAKIAIVAIDATVQNLRKEVPDLVKKASEKKAAGDKRGAMWLLLRRRGILKRIERYEKSLKELVKARDCWMAQRRAQGGSDESVMVAYEKVMQKVAEKKAEEKAEARSPAVPMTRTETEQLLAELGALEEKNVSAVMGRFKKVMKRV
eukprot:TRINITY_DN2053_c0_g1_i3.p1 TRINITY_DN2053_c0_g1~~TRINITY_DN2053_c0_g1_i3.p1  ORF type:complete len:160 (+),score=47.17 TRINITY_DN2053_c0_g1_i3:119-598(+)